MWKKVWKDDEAVSPVIAVILMVAITVVLAAVLYVWAQSFTSRQETNLTIGWNVETRNDNYRIDIITVDTIGLNEVAFSLLTDNFVPASTDDGMGGTLRFNEVDVDDVNFTQADYDAADSDPDLNTWYNLFYEKDGGGLNNATAYIVFIDVNSDGKMNSGDTFWIRSYDNGGLAREDYVFRLLNKQLDKKYGDMVLPAT